MKDQASALRQIVDNLRKQRTREPGEGARIICVTSGKGGVGKTSISVNLGISLAKKGLRVLLFDADFGLSNIDVMLGVSPQYDLSYVLRGQKKIGEIIAEGPGGINFVSGGSGMNVLLNMSEIQLSAVIDNLVLLEDAADIIIFDTGAGVNPLIMRMIRSSQETIVVTTPEPTAIMDAYALVKSIAADTPDGALRLLVNRAESSAEAEATLQKFVAVVKLYQKTDMDLLGYVLDDPSVSRGVRIQQPFVLSYPRCAATRNIETIAWKLLDRQPETASTGIRGFLGRLLGRGEKPARNEKPDEE
ncbi:MAG: MinD/ParA family protein [Oscillospiraceae bacterium]|jgi:flagellar biosynthesis protein FlhG|nr:MinD/ParA family protein [Oscillospiraceae bacterium]